MNNDERDSLPVEELEARVLQMLKQYGTFTATKEISSQLNLGTVETYYILQALVSRNEAVARRGRSGGFCLPPKELTSDDAAKPTRSTINELREPYYYSRIMEEVEAWMASLGFENVVVNTSSSGALHTGGQWTRPDLYCIAKKKFKYYPFPVFEFISFEVKLVESLTVLSVYEALNHRKAATQCYLLVIGDPNSLSGDVKDEVENTCIAHGVGLIYIPAEVEDGGHENWLWGYEARSVKGDAERIDDFLATQVQRLDELMILR